jgi:hypothetical protein
LFLSTPIGVYAGLDRPHIKVEGLVFLVIGERSIQDHPVRITKMRKIAILSRILAKLTVIRKVFDQP